MITIPDRTLARNPSIALHPLIAALPAGGEIPLYVPGRPKPVAGVCVRPDGQIELHKWIRASVHLTTTPRAIAFDADLFRYACELGAQVVRVKDIETDYIYTTDVATFNRYAFTQDRAFGAQRFLKLEHWSINGAPPAYTPPAARAPEPEELQLGLFAGGAR
jgi:hypothetical protein